MKIIKKRPQIMTVDDCINGLLHLGDDHPCCKVFCNAVIDTLRDLEREVERNSGPPEWLNEALNSGDGVYRP